MAESIREQLIKAVLARMAVITKANGYETDIGSNVFRGLRAPLAGDELPATIVNEGEEDADDGITAGMTHYKLPLEISARHVFKSDESWNQIANKMKADIIKAIGVDPKFGELALDTEEGGSRIGIEEGGEHNITGADVNVVVKYRTIRLNPYA